MTDLTLTPPDAPASPGQGADPGELAVAPASASPLLARPGAVPSTGPDVAVAWHYGDPVAEQRRLEAGTARTDLSHRGVIRIAGPDRLGWLHSLSTQHLSALQPYASAEALILSPHGHVEHSMHLVDDGTATWITVEPGAAGSLIGWLERMRFMLRVEVADLSADWAVLGEPLDREAEPGEPLAWRDPWPGVVAGGVSYGPATAPEHPGWRWREVLVPRPEFDRQVAAGELDGAAGTWAVDALRVAAWRPRFGFETDHRTIPHEVDWLRTAVHLQKGCYRGQETVARVHNLGRPPRRLVLLHLDGSEHELPAIGAAVLLGDKQVGRVTTPARHHELGPIALAVIKRSIPVDAQLSAGGIAAAQEVVVGS